MPTDKNPEAEAGLPATLNALPLASKFNIELSDDDEGKFSDELQGYHQYGQITIGEDVYGFSNFSTQGSMQVRDYEDQWRAAARRILSGHDRTAFITNDGGGGWATAFGGRWLMWREGERVYVAADHTPIDPYDNAGPNAGIESLQSRCARGITGISALSLQAIRDFLWPDPATQSILAAELASQAAVVDEPDTAG